MKKLLIILISLTLLTACGEKKIDGSSINNLNTSIQEITKSLNETEQEAFKQALGKISLVAAFEAKGGNENQIQEILMKKLGGKTAAEVIKFAEQEKNPLSN